MSQPPSTYSRIVTLHSKSISQKEFHPPIMVVRFWTPNTFSCFSRNTWSRLWNRSHSLISSTPFKSSPNHREKSRLLSIISSMACSCRLERPRTNRNFTGTMHSTIRASFQLMRNSPISPLTMRNT